MIENWKVGDKAVSDPTLPRCGHCTETDGPPAAMVVRTVSKAVPFTGEPMGLDFYEEPAANYGQYLYCACIWRKLVDDEAKGERADWQLLLNSVKRKVDA